MASVAQLLREKRAQLEQDVAEFRRKKEEEYKSFEQQFLQHDASKLVLDNLDEAPQAKVESQNQEQGPEIKRGALPSQNGDQASPSGARGSGYAPIADQISSSNDRAASPPSEPISGPKPGNASRCHEREEEFKGLFTPSYLPLLDDHRRRPNLQIRETKNSAQRECTSTEQQLTTHFSSSATLPSAHFNALPSPPPARPLSASVPREPSHHRRTSSRSDISIASLRSSFRDPKQPRSPKRVLFSLDNAVVSPSTSPIAQRRKTDGEAVQLQVVDGSQILKNFGPAAIGSTNGYPPYPRQDRALPIGKSAKRTTNGDHDAASTSTQAQGTTNGFSAMGGDEFESINIADELFAFDEDFSDGEADAAMKLDVDDLGSDEDGQDSEQLTATSPHAGSLPIEIKWPQRLKPHG